MKKSVLAVCVLAMLGCERVDIGQIVGMEQTVGQRTPSWGLIDPDNCPEIKEYIGLELVGGPVKAHLKNLVWPLTIRIEDPCNNLYFEAKYDKPEMLPREDTPCPIVNAPYESWLIKYSEGPEP